MDETERQKLLGMIEDDLTLGSHLKGTTLKSLLDYEYNATSYSLTTLDRPNYTIVLEKICEETGMLNHDFSIAPFELTALEIKSACQNFRKNGEKEPRILCKQDTRDSRPQLFKDKGLYILPKHNGTYYILKGEGYIDIPDITTPILTYHKKLDLGFLT